MHVSSRLQRAHWHSEQFEVDRIRPRVQGLRYHDARLGKGIRI
jgi:hypothetical protein